MLKKADESLAPGSASFFCVVFDVVFGRFECESASKEICQYNNVLFLHEFLLVFCKLFKKRIPLVLRCFKLCCFIVAGLASKKIMSNSGWSDAFCHILSAANRLTANLAHKSSYRPLKTDSLWLAGEGLVHTTIPEIT